MDGDEKGWLAAVDPDLRSRYRTLYRNLRGLDVSHLEYHAYPRPGGDKDTTVDLTAHLSYCFSVPTCPEWRRDEYSGPPRLTQQLTLTLVGGRYIVTEIDSSDGNHLQPTPWEGAELAFARGKRVTVAGPKSQAKKLKRVLAVAEKAAVASDRFAKYLDNPQQRYRVYVADKKAWNSWYGGLKGDWVVGYAIPLHDTGTDVILRSSKLGSDEQLRTTVKHELGHAVTLGGTAIRDFDSDQWLSEGIAEYIGGPPNLPATAGTSTACVTRSEAHGRRRRSCRNRSTTSPPTVRSTPSTLWATSPRTASRRATGRPSCSSSSA